MHNVITKTILIFFAEIVDHVSLIRERPGLSSLVAEFKP